MKKAFHHPAVSKLGRRYLYRPPHPNRKFELMASLPLLAPGPIAAEMDLRPMLAAPRDQGAEGACSGFSSAAFRECLHAVASGTPLQGYLAPAYLYGKTRQAEGTFPADSGCSIADEFGTLQAYGVCPEDFLPYSGNASEAPTPAADVAATPFRIGQPMMVDFSSVDAMHAVLSKSMPIVFGMACYQSFENTGTDGVVPEVNPDEGLLGGHALLLVGYQQDGTWIVRNSWGTGWGQNGYCFMPQDYTDHWLEAWTATPVA